MSGVSWSPPQNSQRFALGSGAAPSPFPASLGRSPPLFPRLRMSRRIWMPIGSLGCTFPQDEHGFSVSGASRSGWISSSRPVSFNHASRRVLETSSGLPKRL